MYTLGCGATTLYIGHPDPVAPIVMTPSGACPGLGVLNISNAHAQIIDGCGLSYCSSSELETDCGY